MNAAALPLAALLLAGTACLADEATFYLPDALAARVENGTRSGLSVAVDVQAGGARVTVSEAVRALAGAPAWGAFAPARCGDPTALEVPAGFALPHALAVARAAADTPLEAMSSLVAFVATHVTTDEGDLGPQDAASVLRRGRGRCSGRANLAIGLLRAAGIPARAVHGVAVGDRGARWHRWGEAWLGTLGWVPFDPGVSLGAVSVRYLPLAGAGEGATPAGIRVGRVDERGFLALPVRSGMRVVPTEGTTLRFFAPSGAPDITALLLAPDGSRWGRRGVHEVVFRRMLPGHYRLVWSDAGRVGALELEIGSERAVRVVLPAVKEAGT